MGRSSKNTQEYEELAQSRGLTFTGKVAPMSVFDKTWWVCNNPGCNKEHYKTYRAVYLKEHGCICQTNMVLKESAYHELAAEWGIEWLGPRPGNSNQPTNWRTSLGNVVSLPYQKLAHRVSKATLRLIDVYTEDAI
jgi:hypothetical protein